MFSLWEGLSLRQYKLAVQKAFAQVGVAKYASITEAAWSTNINADEF